MDDILRFRSAVKLDPGIDAWLSAQRDDLRRLAETGRDSGSDWVQVITRRIHTVATMA